MQWDDLRIVLAIARAGSLAGAARGLGVNHSTVFRRLNTFEETLGVRLFERLQSGYALTVAGEEMRASAELMEREIDRLDRRITGQDLRLHGSLVVTTTDTLATSILGPHIGAF
jgi:molybdate transport repressor ModE-like protein